MTNEELILLSQVRRKVKEKPEFVGHIVSIMTQGLVESVKEYQHMAADMETLASVAISMAGEKRVTKKTKEYFEKLALSKLEKYQGGTFSKWDWAYKKDV